MRSSQKAQAHDIKKAKPLGIWRDDVIRELTVRLEHPLSDE